MRLPLASLDALLPASERAGWPADHPFAEVRRLYGIEVACCPVPKDRAGQSAAVRACAAALLGAHGVVPVSIGRLPSGAPHWPDGWVGSLSHAPDGGAVAVARSASLQTVGIDFEDPTRMHRALWSHMLSAGELKELTGVPEAAANQRAAEVFSAKEAIYKALAPLGGPVPGFHEVEIRWSADGAFRAQRVAPPARAGGPADTPPVDLDLSGLICPLLGHVLALVWRTVPACTPPPI